MGLVQSLHHYDQGSAYPGSPLGGGHRGHGGPPIHRGPLCLASSLCWLARGPRLKTTYLPRPTNPICPVDRLKSLVELDLMKYLPCSCVLSTALVALTWCNFSLTWC